MGELHTRPTIELRDKKFYLNDEPVRVVFRKGKISIGCSDITPEALWEIWHQYSHWRKDVEQPLELDELIYK